MIMIGNVFNRSEKSYYVLFDNYKNYMVNILVKDKNYKILKSLSILDDNNKV